MSIFVKQSDTGAKTVFRVSAATWVDKLHAEVASTLNVNPMSVRLLIDGERLDTWKPKQVGDYDIMDGDEIELIKEMLAGEWRRHAFPPRIPLSTGI